MDRRSSGEEEEEEEEESRHVMLQSRDKRSARARLQADACDFLSVDGKRAYPRPSLRTRTRVEVGVWTREAAYDVHACKAYRRQM